MTPDISTSFQATLMSLLLTLVTVVSPLVVYYVKRFVDEKLAALKARMGEQQWVMIQNIASVVVDAAEQNGLTGAIASEAEAKKQWALQQLQLALTRHGITEIHLDVLDAAIEAAVKNSKPVARVAKLRGR